MIVWSGWGIMVAILAAIGLLVGIFIGSSLGLPEAMATPVSLVFAGVLGGAATFFLARAIEGKPGRVFIDEVTQQRIEVRDNAGSLFFIPTRYWAFILPVVGIAFGAMMYLNPADPLPERGSPEALAADAAVLEAARKEGLLERADAAPAASAQQTAQPAEASQAGGGGN